MFPWIIINIFLEFPLFFSFWTLKIYFFLTLMEISFSSWLRNASQWGFFFSDSMRVLFWWLSLNFESDDWGDVVQKINIESNHLNSLRLFDISRYKLKSEAVSHIIYLFEWIRTANHSSKRSSSVMMSTEATN